MPAAPRRIEKASAFGFARAVRSFSYSTVARRLEEPFGCDGNQFWLNAEEDRGVPTGLTGVDSVTLPAAPPR